MNSFFLTIVNKTKSKGNFVRFWWRSNDQVCCWTSRWFDHKWIPLKIILTINLF